MAACMKCGGDPGPVCPKCRKESAGVAQSGQSERTRPARRHGLHSGLGMPPTMAGVRKQFGFGD